MCEFGQSNAEVKMDEAEQGRIALKLVVMLMRERPMPAPEAMRRDLGNIARRIGEDPEKILAFYIEILPQLVGVMLGTDKVGITTGDIRPFGPHDRGGHGGH